MNLNAIIKRVMQSGLTFQITGIADKFYFVKVTTPKSMKWFSVEMTNNLLYIASGIGDKELKRTEYSSDEKLMEYLEHALVGINIPQEPEAFEPKKKKK